MGNTKYIIQYNTIQYSKTHNTRTRWVVLFGIISLRREAARRYLLSLLHVAPPAMAQPDAAAAPGGRRGVVDHSQLAAE